MSDLENPTDPYIDPETGILRNRVGARTQAELDEAEADLGFARLNRYLETRPVRGTGDLEELRGIHRYLLEDVYDWAGEIRVVDLRKNIPGADPFMPVSLIQRGAGFVAEELRADRMLAGMSRDRFVDRLAHHYDQVNHLHPFREGNGRTQRVFWSRVAIDAGWQLDWRSVTGQVNDEACRIAAGPDRNLNPLRKMFDEITSPADIDARTDKARLGLQAARHAFPSSHPAPEKQAISEDLFKTRSRQTRGRGGEGPER